MANITKRTWKNGKTTYRVLIRVKGHEPLTESFDRLTDAKKWAMLTETAVRTGRHLKEDETKRHTIAELVDRYIEEVLPRKPKSARVQGPQLMWWRKRLGAMALTDVTPFDLATCRDELGKELTPRGTPRSPASVVRYLAVLSHAFTIATKDWGWLENNPMLRVTKPKEPRGRVRYLTEDEKKKLLEACRQRNPALFPVVTLGIFTAMRKSEILGLRWQDLDFERRRILLDKTKNGDRRGVTMVDDVYDALVEWRDATKIIKPRGHVFPSKVVPQKAVDPRSSWETARDDAGLEDFHFHDLRHTAASYLAMVGASPTEISEILGHKTMSMVKRYAHISEGHSTSVLKRMAERFGEKKRKEEEE